MKFSINQGCTSLGGDILKNEKSCFHQEGFYVKICGKNNNAPFDFIHFNGLISIIESVWFFNICQSLTFLLPQQLSFDRLSLYLRRVCDEKGIFEGVWHSGTRNSTHFPSKRRLMPFIVSRRISQNVERRKQRIIIYSGRGMHV